MKYPFQKPFLKGVKHYSLKMMGCMKKFVRMEEKTTLNLSFNPNKIMTIFNVNIREEQIKKIKEVQI